MHLTTHLRPIPDTSGQLRTVYDHLPFHTSAHNCPTCARTWRTSYITQVPLSAHTSHTWTTGARGITAQWSIRASRQLQIFWSSGLVSVTVHHSLKGQSLLS